MTKSLPSDIFLNGAISTLLMRVLIEIRGDQMGLTERKEKILETIISDYIKRAEPVGSRTLTRRYNFDISPATIRNEMADLEEMGYLAQPHTSAGRVPTEKGYRLFVDKLIKAGLLNPSQDMLMKALQSNRIHQIDEIIQITARALADLTNYTSLVLGPQASKSAFQNLQLIPISGEELLMVLVTDAGLVESRPIGMHDKLTVTEAQNIATYLNEKLKGLTIDEMTPTLLRELRTELVKQMDVLETALTILSDSFKQSSNKVALGGTTKILNQPEFNDLEKVKQLLSFFENEELLVELLSHSEGIVVRIGEENPLEEVQDCSIITASYELYGKPLGTIGVLGPTRMDYSRVIAIVAQIAKELTVALSHQKNFREVGDN